MFKYKDYIQLNQKFNRSINIIYDVEDCKSYILTSSAKSVLKVLFGNNTNNSISLIGPFGCGKSSLLLYINSLLSRNDFTKQCVEKLIANNTNLYEEYSTYTLNKSFLQIKLVGEHISFKTLFKNTILENKSLKNTLEYLNTNTEYQISKVLEYISIDIKLLNYTDVIISIDEFGKFIEYSMDESNDNDIFELQTLSEYVNKQSNFKLLVSLHKTFKDYNISEYSTITYSDWDKIQGRFENIVFKDDYYEMLNVFKETISLKDLSFIGGTIQNIQRICKDNIFTKNATAIESELFEQLVPFHPYSILVISEIFSKYFQNQRTIYSFLFSSEPFAFQEFINNELSSYELYSLTNLYDYVSYLLKVYNIILPDREVWYLGIYRLKNSQIMNAIQVDIIKIISLLHTFKLVNIINPDKEHIILALMDKHKTGDIISNIDYLLEKNFIVFQEQTQSFSLIEDSNIDLNKEMKKLLDSHINIDYEKAINKYIKNHFIVAKRFFIVYGNQKSFEKLYVSHGNHDLTLSYKIFLLDNIDSISKPLIDNNNKSIFVLIERNKKLFNLVEQIEVINIIRDTNKEKISLETNEIIESMINDYLAAFDSLLKQSLNKSIIYFQNKQYAYSSKVLQSLISDIAESCYSNSPIFNSYTLNHTIKNKGTNTSILKSLFKKLLEDYDKDDLGFDKVPAEKALYLSIIKPAGIHKFVEDKFTLGKPNDLNFQYVWEYIQAYISKRVPLKDLIDSLALEPFGLDEVKSLFVISSFIIVNKNEINIFRENTYTFELTIDLLMNMWKASEKYELEYISLSQEQQNLFKAYVQITSDICDYAYTKEKVTAITKVLFSKFYSLPDIAKNTLNISKQAISLRATLSSMKEPVESYFIMIPKSLGYMNIKDIDCNEYIKEFKQAFNEMALYYKNILIELESFISEKFYLKVSTFPFNNGLVQISDKLSSLKGLDPKTKAILRSFIYSDSLITLLDSLSVTLVGKEVDKCTDNEILELKNEISDYSKKIFDKLQLSDFSNDKKDILKVSISSIDNNVNKIVTIDKTKIDAIKSKMSDIKSMIPDTYTNDEKVYLLSQLLQSELTND